MPSRPSRIELGFRRRFRELLALVEPRRLDFGVELLMGRGRTRAEQEGLPLARGLFQVFEFTRTRVKRRLAVVGSCTVARPTWERFRVEKPAFLCDASLGGLARWLRAAGFEARWSAREGGDALVGAALAGGLVLLTSDCRVFERRGVQQDRPLALWVPSTLTLHEQLTLVVRDLELKRGEPRCMACGGVLVATPKTAVAQRIPPRTARWKDDYFVCERCDRLYWQGSHWERIADALERDTSA
jgi:uncharacterized protein with PIN domain